MENNNVKKISHVTNIASYAARKLREMQFMETPFPHEIEAHVRREEHLGRVVAFAHGELLRAKQFKKVG